MTFQQQQRAHWAEVIRAAKQHPDWVGIFSLAAKRQWAIKCLAMPGPQGKLL
jgi:hypothetical protein